MQYKVIGLMSGSSLDGLDIACVHFEENAGRWSYEFQATACEPYDETWSNRLAAAASLDARGYCQLHADYGAWIGETVNRFIAAHKLDYNVQLVASHGHTVFHVPEQKMTAQLGLGAAIAAATGIPAVTDLRSGDVALGGQGAPVVPIGETLLLPGYDLYLNLGGIANLSARLHGFVGFDVCPANRVMNLLAQEAGRPFDRDGALAASGSVDQPLYKALNEFPYYGLGYPKSLANEFGTGEVYPLIRAAGLSVPDALRTYVEHIGLQLLYAIMRVFKGSGESLKGRRMLVTGGGAHNKFLVERLRQMLAGSGIEPEVPDARLVDFKESLVIALMGALRWREEHNTLPSVTGASSASTGGAVWLP